MASAVSFSEKAYCKIILHAVKYPHCAVNGVLLTERSKSKDPSSVLSICDCVPLFHVGNGLTAMIEVALTQIDYYCKEKGLILAGYYQGNTNLTDSSPDYFATRIADKIQENFNAAVLVMINNKTLSLDCEEPALNVYSNSDGKWKLNDSSNVLEKERKTLAALSSLLHNKSHRTLVDFDNHLDNVALSWQNISLNEEIARLL